MNKVSKYFKAIFKYKISRIWFAVSVSVIAFFIVLTILAETVFFNLLGPVLGNRKIKTFGATYYTSDYEDESEYEKNPKKYTLQKANELNEKICEEGIVLLKNDGNALPLREGAKISVFGKNSVNLAYGGSGSGAFTVTKETPTIYSSLEAAGFKYNETLKKFYEDNGKSGSGRGDNPSLDNSRSTVPGFSTGETAYDKYPESVKSSYSEYNEAALVVFSRIGGESFDLPRTMGTGFNKDGKVEGLVDGALNNQDHYLELDKNEQDLLVNVCNNFNKVILIINSSATLELGFLDDVEDNDSTLVDGMQGIHSKIQGALWIGGPGYSGINALGRVLKGAVTPSGRTIDTYQRDFTKDPTYQNFADQLVNNGDAYVIPDASKKAEHFVDYEEGIYVGYRYYETRAVKDDGSIDEEWYKNNVVYSFGYGLSYTSFKQEIVDASFADGASLSWTGDKDQDFWVDVKVTNEGDYDGKEVVQIYITAPYTGAIEKSHVVLVGFAKTELLKKNGGTQTVRVEFTGYDFANYDYKGTDGKGQEGTGYKLESGNYDVKLMKNSHELIQKRSFTLSENVEYKNDLVTGTEVKNLYNNVSFEENYGLDSVLSRSSWDTTFPVNEVLKESEDATYKEKRTISQDFYNTITSFETNNPIAKQTNLEMPTVAEVGSPAGKLQLFKLLQFEDDGITAIRDDEGTILIDYDDARWNSYIDILTAQEMMDLTMWGAFQTLSLPSIGLLPAMAYDGPVGFVCFMSSGIDNPVYDTCAYASECVIASTWNSNLAYDMGVSIGNEGVLGNENRPYSGWYAPAVNIHRTPFSGRNFEYYSEDPFISGTLAANVIKGARSKGVYCELKHFAVNDQETHRSGVCTWLTEQALREIYLKPFEIAVKDGGTLGIMSSFNRIGTLWTGGDYRLLTQILRDEWGFQGMVITDFNTESFMDTKQMAYAGGDLNLATLDQSWKPSTAADYIVLRNSVHNILYTTARSNAMNGCGEGAYYITYYAWWETMLIVVDICLGAGAIIWGGFALWIAFSRVKKEELAAVEVGEVSDGDVPPSNDASHEESNE